MGYQKVSFLLYLKAPDTGIQIPAHGHFFSPFEWYRVTDGNLLEHLFSNDDTYGWFYDLRAAIIAIQHPSSKRKCKNVAVSEEINCNYVPRYKMYAAHRLHSTMLGN